MDADISSLLSSSSMPYACPGRTRITLGLRPKHDFPVRLYNLNARIARRTLCAFPPSSFRPPFFFSLLQHPSCVSLLLSGIDFKKKASQAVQEECGYPAKGICSIEPLDQSNLFFFCVLSSFYGLCSARRPCRDKHPSPAQVRCPEWASRRSGVPPIHARIHR